MLVSQVLYVMIMHGRCSALVELDSVEARDRFLAHYSEHPHALRHESWAKPAVASIGAPRSKDPQPPEMHSEEVVRREVKRCIDQLVRDVATDFSNYRRKVRRLAREEHNKELRKLEQEARERADGVEADAEDAGDNICWDFVKRGGRCPRGDQCRFVHKSLPISSLPMKHRFLITHDAFTPRKEISQNKVRINNLLTDLTRHLPNRRCLTLDGPNCNTVTALRRCEVQPREAADIVVPSVSTQTFQAIRDQGLCTSYLGSIRLYLDSHGGERFGLIYLDYCSRLGAGWTSIEKSPPADIQRVFELQFCDERGCVLAICLCDEERKPESFDTTALDAPQMLRHLVAVHAARHQRVAVPYTHRIEYEGHFVELFLVGAAEHMDTWLAQTVGDATAKFMH